jgi:hypothetical protein
VDQSLFNLNPIKNVSVLSPNWPRGCTKHQASLEPMDDTWGLVSTVIVRNNSH